ncbi:hypothetical protein AZE42_12551 [Rhizopogon vesiculosus]|uniref:Uncharacterized protein n=1 Tax=Rhizopogon vesiculosus TaxID=180088 RepID=A0A1J8QDH9_9AGAM|nr:hypothetical protein AZE42_12551 [Rhizopogon vesiculosus]
MSPPPHRRPTVRSSSVSLSTFELDRYPSLMCSSSSFRALQSASLDIPHRVASPTPSNADASVSLSTFDLERFPSLICPSSSFRALASASRRSSAASSFSFSTSMDDADVTISLSSSFSKYPSLLSSSPSFTALGSATTTTVVFIRNSKVHEDTPVYERLPHGRGKLYWLFCGCGLDFGGFLGLDFDFLGLDFGFSRTGL